MIWRFSSLRARLLCGTLLVIVLVMATVMAVVEHRQRVAIIGEVERRGESLAQSLAAMSYGPLLLYNFTALEQNAVRVSTEADVVYAIVLDADGRVAAHSRHSERVGLSLGSAVDRRVAEAQVPVTQTAVLAETGDAIYDFAVPVQVDRQKWGTVRVGLSKRRMDAEIRRTRWELGTLTVVMLVMGGLGAALLAARMADPVRQLAEGATAVSRGELDQRIEPSTVDEIGGAGARLQPHDGAALPAAHGARGRARRAISAFPGAGRPQELYGQHPQLAHDGCRHDRSRGTGGDPEPRRRAAHRLLRR